MRILEAKELFAGIVKELSSQIANHVLLATGSMVANKFAGIVLGNLTTYVIEGTKKGLTLAELKLGAIEFFKSSGNNELLLVMLPKLKLWIGDAFPEIADMIVSFLEKKDGKR